MKVLPAVSALAVLWISLVLCEDCLYTNQVWGGSNPNEFYYCNPVTNQAESANCGPNQGFVDNGTAAGCIPWSDWSDNCVSKTDVSDITCENDTYLSLAGSGDPNFFYLCLAQNSTPVQVPCPDGTLFYTGNNYMGCYPWEMWRNITGCTNV